MNTYSKIAEAADTVRQLLQTVVVEVEQAEVGEVT